MSKKICSKCQEVNSSSAMICTYCGNTLGASKIVKEDKVEEHIERGRFTGGLDEISIGSWFGIIFILAIPLINIIALFVIAFGNSNETLKNYAKAHLIFIGIGLALVLLLRGCSTML